MHDITALVKTFDRHQSIQRLVESLQEFAPNMPVIVADDGRVPADLPPHVRHLRLPFDVGISRGRNEALELIDTPFFLLLDDDYVFSNETSIDAMSDPVRRGDWDLVGGRWLQGGQYIEHHLLLERRGPYLLKIPGCRGVRDGIAQYDIVNNFFVARTDAIRVIGGWHPELKVAEHMMFFAKCQAAGLRIGATDRSTIVHAPTSDEHYNKFRRRGITYLEKHGPSKYNLLGFYEHDGQFFDLAPRVPHPEGRTIATLSVPRESMLGVSFVSATVGVERGGYELHVRLEAESMPEDAVCVVHAFGESDLLPLDRREHGFHNLDFPLEAGRRTYARQLHIPSGRYRFEVGVYSAAGSAAEVATFGEIDLVY